MGESISIFRRRLSAVVLLFFMTAADQLAVETRSFDIETGNARTTLREFAKQARVSVVMDRPDVRGVQTNEVFGLLVPRHALARMLEGTPLIFKEDLETGAFAVTRSKVSVAELTTESSEVQNPEPERKPKTTTPMNDKKQTFGSLLKGLLTFAAVGAPTLSAQDDDDEDILELSPFIVTASEDSGYRATTTLAGSRLNTQLRDVGAAVSVLTSERFEDTGATDAGTILPYALNTETGGVQGNFAGGAGVANDGNSRANTTGSRINPQDTQRIRGLASAELARSYFLTDIPFDSYNTDRVTVNRGPNSLLFGIGSPGGVINNSLKQASLSKDFGEVSVRFGERSSHRESFDYNSVLVDDRLALRIAGLYSDTQYQQRPAFTEDKRIYAAFTGIALENENSEIFGKTIIRGNYESGTSDSNPPNVIAPTDGISAWFETPDTALESITGTSFPGWASDGSFVPKFTTDSRPGISESSIPGSVQIPYFIQLALHYQNPNSQAANANVGGDFATAEGGIGRVLFSTSTEGRGRFDLYNTVSPFARSYFPGFTVPSLPLSVFDNENLLITGTTNQAKRDFDAFNLTLEQSLFNGNGGIEVSVDEQTYSTWLQFPFTGGSSGGVSGNYDVVVDINEYLSNDEPNPNLGRLMMKQTNLGGFAESLNKRESTRATAFYELDFADSDRLGFLGRHVLTGFLSEQSIDVTSRGYDNKWVSERVDIERFNFADISGFRRNVVGAVYFGDSLLGSSVQSLEDIKITETISIPIPQDGDQHSLWYWDSDDREVKQGDFEVRSVLLSGNRTKRQIDTEAISMQSYLFNGNLVGLLGWRTDSQVNQDRAGNNRLPNGEWDPANLGLGPELPEERGNTFTWSLVGHVPESFVKLPFDSNLSFHYNSSENFNPVGTRRNARGEILSAPGGTTEDYGFTLELLENRLAFRLNSFKTSASNATAPLSGNAYSWVGTWLNRWNDAELVGLTIDETLAAAGAPAGFFSSYQDAYDTILNLLPTETQSLLNYEYNTGSQSFEVTTPILGLVSTTSFVTEGLELDVVGNLNDNWRVAFNVGKQETVQSNIAPVVSQLANQINANILSAGLENFLDSPVLGEPTTFGQRYAREVLVRQAAVLVQEGTTSLEQRKWRANLSTNYSFNEGRFKGFGVGGAVRWQDKAAAGYAITVNSDGIQVPDLSRPFFGSAQLNGDLWLSYEKRLWERTDWKIQLNVRNAFGDDDIIPVSINPDGSLALFRNSLPTDIFLTNTFKF